MTRISANRGGALRLTLAISATLMIGACHRGANPGAQLPAGGPLVGIVRVVGSAQDERVALETGGRQVFVSADAATTASLKQISGVEISAQGASSGAQFAVSSFTVTRVDGQPVSDGIVRVSGTGLALQVGTTMRMIANPPPALRQLIGVRVWLSGSLETGPNAYGVINRP